jgi:hypothetical protein
MTEKCRDECAGAIEVMQDSRLCAFVQGVAHVVTASTADSKVLRLAGQFRAGYHRLSARERFRSAAVAVSAGAAAHALLLGLVPQPLRPAMPRAFWLILSAAAAGAAVRRSGKDQNSDT